MKLYSDVIINKKKLHMCVLNNERGLSEGNLLYICKLPFAFFSIREKNTGSYENCVLQKWFARKELTARNVQFYAKVGRKAHGNNDFAGIV